MADGVELAEMAGASPALPPQISGSVSKVLLDAMNRSMQQGDGSTPLPSPVRPLGGDEIVPEGTLTKLQRTFAALGFYDPATRFISMFVLSSICVMALRPRPIFRKDGKINDQSYLQWWMPGLAIGAACAFFV